MINILLRDATRQLSELRFMFIDSQSGVDREGLRLYVYQRLTEFRQRADVLCHDKRAYWERCLVSAKQELHPHEYGKVVKLVHQLTGISAYIQGWIDLAVDSPERFDFFVMTKAHELASGNQQNDYFWALQIRHDQLVALVRILDLLLDKMAMWVQIQSSQVFDDPVFSGLTQYGIEDQVYLEAEKVYKERTHTLQSAAI